MLIKKIQHLQTSECLFAIEKNKQWSIIEDSPANLIDVLEFVKQNTFKTKAYNPQDYKDIIPIKPAAYRDFMLYEKHAIDSARGFVKKYMPQAFPVVRLYEKLTGKTFPALKPSKRYYNHPIYYMGNHLNFFSEGDTISKPSYTKELDYELEIAAILTKPLKNATPQDVNNAIGGFVILNDFSARDQQLSEVKSGFGPMKTKNFANAISSVVATADTILPILNSLNVKVYINDKLITTSTSANSKYSMQEAIAYASWEEQLHPGELFGSGTIPGCTGIENGVMLKPGDKITLAIENIGQLTNHIL
jgi:2-keto-4-pentenoate hydratase/2-oxohepta-3-ene-1,7-dioic acid hydratase in catechol pathway